MTGRQKTRGDRAEREAAALLADLTGYPVRRRLGAGRTDDEGDLDGIPDVTIQVADWQAVTRAIVVKPEAAERQRRNAGTGYAATLIRIRGGTWRVVLTPEQFTAYLQAITTEGN